MRGWFRQLVLAMILAVLPFQGLAATLTVVLCHGDAQLHAAHAPGHDAHDGHAGHDAHDGHVGHAGHVGQADHDPGNTGQVDDGATASYHLCCNVTVSVPVGFTLPGTLPEFPVLALAPDPLHDLYIPDRPQRPPLA